MGNTKHWWQSKLVWLGILETVIGIATFLSDWLRESDYSPASVALLVAGIATVILRVWFTNQAIRVRG